MVTILPPGSPTDRAWNGCETTAGHHHGRVPLSQSPISLSLRWRASKSAPAHFVGCYRLDLDQLVSAGYARKIGDQVLLRFQSAGEVIEIATNRHSPALVVGRNPIFGSSSRR